MMAIQEEHNKFERTKVRFDVPPLKTTQLFVGVFKNKLNENGKIVKNKARLVMKSFAKK